MRTMKTISIPLLLVLVMLCHARLTSADSALYTDKKNYRTNESIQVHFSNAPGSTKDWISVVPSGTPDNVAGEYQYIPNGMTSGLLTFYPQNPGQYEVRAYYDYRKKGYTVSFRSQFTVFDSDRLQYVDEKKQDINKLRISHKGLLIFTDKDRYQQNESVQVCFFESTQNSGDWISVVPVGTADTDAGNYQYLPVGMEQGILEFPPLTPGKYEARVYYNYKKKGYVVSARYPFTVGDTMGSNEHVRKKKN